MVASRIALLSLFMVFAAVSGKHRVHQTLVSSTSASIIFKPAEGHKRIHIDLFTNQKRTFEFGLEEVPKFFGYTCWFANKMSTKAAKLRMQLPMVAGVLDERIFMIADATLHVYTLLECEGGHYGAQCEKTCNAKSSINQRCDSLGRIRCDYGWMGPQCAQVIDPRECGCQNQGACVSTRLFESNIGAQERLTCECRPGFGGDFCEIITNKNATLQTVDPCALSGVCQNDAQCISNGLVPFCSCAPGFAGKYCNIKLQPLEEPPAVGVNPLYIVLIIILIIAVIAFNFFLKRKYNNMTRLLRASNVKNPSKVFIVENCMYNDDEEAKYAEPAWKF
ncbi:unnamed protein product [Caenorhabditis bovis]|uniref:Delta-like protein n=1 Tax=Caenorhabditis bovis TaxID=2654633 RepID=A0A8S1E5K7_9PELO|nr:unnamed protein product [Caenorhabditis bovis]